MSALALLPVDKLLSVYVLLSVDELLLVSKLLSVYECLSVYNLLFVEKLNYYNINPRLFPFLFIKFIFPKIFSNYISFNYIFAIFSKYFLSHDHIKLKYWFPCYLQILPTLNLISTQMDDHLRISRYSMLVYAFDVRYNRLGLLIGEPSSHSVWFRDIPITSMKIHLFSPVMA